MTDTLTIAELRQCAIKNYGYEWLGNDAYYAQADMLLMGDCRNERSEQSRMFLLFVAESLEKP